MRNVGADDEADIIFGKRNRGMPDHKKKAKKEASLEERVSKPTPLKKPGVPSKRKDPPKTADMGTSREYGNKNMLMSKSRGYLLDQLSLRGERLSKAQMKSKGAGALAKKELVDKILKIDGLTNV